MIFGQRNLFFKLSAALFVVAFICQLDVARADDPEIAKIKSEILRLAESFSGQGDQDYSRQRSIEPLVRRLIELSPQAPVSDRLSSLHGVWKQVWGPYDYRNDDRGVDPELGVEEIYQAVYPGGYYYNVSPLYKNGNRDKVRIGLLRGEYRLDNKDPNALTVKFTNYPGVKGRPDGVEIWKLATQAEECRNKRDGKKCQLKNRTKIVPTTIVRLFFNGGALKEVYTDDSLRIVYGANDTDFKNPYLYVMVKVDQL